MQTIFLEEILILQLEGKLNTNDDWIHLFMNYKLSENMIEKYMFKLDDLDIYYVIVHQKLSESFIEKHLEAIDHWHSWRFLYKYQKLSKSFIQKHIDKFKFATIKF